MVGRAWFLGVFVSVAASCGPGADPPPAVGPGSVLFAIEPVDATRAGRVGWLATYRGEGRAARFRIELQPEPRGAKLPAFVNCALVREPDSDGSALLRDLARALGGSVPSPHRGVSQLDVPAVILGRDLSRGGGGDRVAGLFGSEPEGDWIATKLFLGDGEGEVFLNLDPIGRHGELSIKDPVYAGSVLRALGRLLGGVGIVAVTPLLEDPDPTNQVRAANALADFGQTREAVAYLTAFLAGGDQHSAAFGLSRLGPEARSAVPLLTDMLENRRSPQDGYAACHALAAIGRDASIALPALRAASQDVNKSVRDIATYAIREIE